MSSYAMNEENNLILPNALRVHRLPPNVSVNLTGRAFGSSTSLAAPLLEFVYSQWYRNKADMQSGMREVTILICYLRGAPGDEGAAAAQLRAATNRSNAGGQCTLS